MHYTLYHVYLYDVMMLPPMLHAMLYRAYLDNVVCPPIHNPSTACVSGHCRVSKHLLPAVLSTSFFFC